MAGGIASVELVSASSTLGLLSFFGAGGLDPELVEQAVTQLKSLTGPWGVNLWPIHCVRSSWWIFFPAP